MEIKEVTSRRTLMVRLTTPFSKLSEKMGEVYNEITSYAQKKGIEFSGDPYAMYYNMDIEALDVEMGFPVDGENTGEGRITTGEIPGGIIASAVHVGPYEKIEGTYKNLLEYIKTEGREVHDWMYEYYLKSPMEVKPEELQTRICYPLK